MAWPFPPLWMRAEDGTSVDVSGIYYFVIFAIALVTLPLWFIPLAQFFHWGVYA